MDVGPGKGENLEPKSVHSWRNKSNIRAKHTRSGRPSPTWRRRHSALRRTNLKQRIQVHGSYQLSSCTWIANANAGQKIETLNLVSETKHITHGPARRLGLRSERVTLVVKGVWGITMEVKTKRYSLKVRVKTPRGTEKVQEVICYGLDDAAKVHQKVKAEKLKKFFPDTDLEDLHRLEHIELLISQKNQPKRRLALQRVKAVGDLILWESPLGKTVVGVHPELHEVIDVALPKCETHFARLMETVAVKYQEITGLQGCKNKTKSTIAGREFLE